MSMFRRRFSFPTSIADMIGLQIAQVSSYLDVAAKQLIAPLCDSTRIRRDDEEKVKDSDQSDLCWVLTDGTKKYPRRFPSRLTTRTKIEAA